MSSREAIRRAVSKYQAANKENMKAYTFKMSKTTDKDIVDKLAEIKNKQGYIKELIRKDLENKSMYLLVNVSTDESGKLCSGKPTFYGTEEEAIASAKESFANNFGISIDEIGEEYESRTDGSYILSKSIFGRLEVYTVAKVEI